MFLVTDRRRKTGKFNVNNHYGCEAVGVLESKHVLFRDWNCINEVSAGKRLLQKLLFLEYGKTGPILIEYSRCISIHRIRQNIAVCAPRARSVFEQIRVLIFGFSRSETAWTTWYAKCYLKFATTVVKKWSLRKAKHLGPYSPNSDPNALRRYKSKLFKDAWHLENSIRIIRLLFLFSSWILWISYVSSALQEHSTEDSRAREPTRIPLEYVMPWILRDDFTMAHRRLWRSLCY